ncbi:putative DNA-binding protein (MmcQ/YjbR family) [Catalinimonas alkaloidigena]|uniref:MmcQ/YjbR family DNA-binding protein n=1 Tax=Catalinimonas alkaloidigena TaxID=1075417 RepID=UPI0024070E53|nr:MmcQ/YjbR family DNA-binding protein [Catalinimonas alkaloidigena]MDF9797186.1 putative DNA-binding protein (MmcQ/YjbR family) [Catalinimonas alkaloidigena]
MDIESFRAFCLVKKGVTEEFPFDEQTLVFKVAGKMFALTHVDSFESVNLKCDPDQAELLREQYQEVIPGYHMNKKHWNTVLLTGSIGDKLLQKWVDDSYALVVKGLPKKLQSELNQ